MKLADILVLIGNLDGNEKRYLKQVSLKEDEYDTIFLLLEKKKQSFSDEDLKKAGKSNLTETLDRLTQKIIDGLNKIEKDPNIVLVKELLLIKQLVKKGATGVALDRIEKLLRQTKKHELYLLSLQVLQEKRNCITAQIDSTEKMQLLVAITGEQSLVLSKYLEYKECELLYDKAIQVIGGTNSANFKSNNWAEIKKELTLILEHPLLKENTEKKSIRAEINSLIVLFICNQYINPDKKLVVAYLIKIISIFHSNNHLITSNPTLYFDMLLGVLDQYASYKNMELPNLPTYQNLVNEIRTPQNITLYPTTNKRIQYIQRSIISELSYSIRNLKFDNLAELERYCISIEKEFGENISNIAAILLRFAVVYFIQGNFVLASKKLVQLSFLEEKGKTNSVFMSGKLLSVIIALEKNDLEHTLSMARSFVRNKKYSTQILYPVYSLVGNFILKNPTKNEIKTEDWEELKQSYKKASQPFIESGTIILTLPIFEEYINSCITQKPLLDLLKNK